MSRNQQLVKLWKKSLKQVISKRSICAETVSKMLEKHTTLQEQK